MLDILKHVLQSNTQFMINSERIIFNIKIVEVVEDLNIKVKKINHRKKQ
jgi:hypothetical protein